MGSCTIHTCSPILITMSETIHQQNPEDIIDAVRPDHQSIEWYEGGDNRDVIVVDGVEAFRFPKDDGGVEVGRFEFEAVSLMQNKLHVAVPKPIELAPDGSYNVLEFLQGTVLKSMRSPPSPMISAATWE